MYSISQVGSIAGIGATRFFDAFFLSEGECLFYLSWREIVSYFLIKKEYIQRVLYTLITFYE